MSDAKPGLWVSDPDAYRRKMAELLGERDPLEILSSTPAALRKLLAENPAERFRSRPFADKWTPCEIIGHLVDTEFVYGFRFRLILCEDQPEIRPMDQDLWVLGQNYQDRSPNELISDFAAMREINLGLCRRMTPLQLERTCRHCERGCESLATMHVMLAGHDLSHLDQLDRYLGAAG